MRDEYADWIPYPSGGHGGRTTTGECVTITGHGSMAISEALTKDIPAGHPYMMIRLKPDTRDQLLLTPYLENVKGTLTITMPTEGKRRGRAARLGTAAGFRDMGIIPPEGTRYPASWRNGSILVDLSRPLDVVAGGKVLREKTKTSQSAPVETPRGGPTVGSTVPGVAARRTCETCLHRRDGGICRNEKATAKFGLQVGAGDGCADHVHRHPPNPPSEPKGQKPDLVATAKHGKRPMGICPGCGRSIQVTGKGMFPHDVSGVLYVAGHGDPDRRCPGSNQPPME